MADVLLLASEGLLSKFGFNDGDEPDDLLDWLEERAALRWDDYEWHPILRRLVRERLLTVLDQRVEAVDIETIHNPIRAETVNSVNVEDCWYGDQPAPTLTPEWVTVPFEDVLAMIRERRQGHELPVSPDLESP